MRVQRFPNPVFVALDTPDLGRAVELGTALKPHVGGLKVGLEFISAQGPDGIRKIVSLGLPVFADVKFHDIPNTVAGACRALAHVGATLMNIHASGGEEMMRAGAEAARKVDPKTLVLGVTVLTSLDDGVLASVGQKGPAAEQVVRLATLAKTSGLDGVVCAVHEIALTRKACGPDFVIVTPGIRPAGAAINDQRRFMAPAEACRAGADILVVGRPITDVADPVAAARAIALELAETMA